MKTWSYILFVALLGASQSDPRLENRPRNIEADLSKSAIETSAERVVEATTRLTPEMVERASGEASVRSKTGAAVDRSKITIESGAESLVGKSRSSKGQPDGSAMRLAPAVRPPVMRVKPGLINWHQNYDVAQAAARLSGKPILLFQLLGNLDEQFT